MHCSCNVWISLYNTLWGQVTFPDFSKLAPGSPCPNLAGRKCNIPLMELPLSVACGIQGQGMGTCSGEEAACPPVALLPLPALQWGWGLQHLLGTPETPQL